MKIFQTTRKIYEHLGVYQPQAFENHSISSNFWAASLVLLIAVISTLMCILTEARTMQEYSDCFYGLVTAIANLLFLIIIFWKASNMFKLIEEFEAVIEKRIENTVSQAIYEEANEKAEKWTKLIEFLMMKLTLFGITTPFLVLCYYLYFATDLENESFRLPFLMWHPFDWKDPINYLVAFTVDVMCIYCVLLATASILIYATTSCCMILAFVNDLKQEVNTLNAIGKDGRNQTELKGKLSEFVEFHVTVKEFAFKYADAYEFIFLIYFLWSSVTICSTLLIAEFELVGFITFNNVIFKI
ncbi:uncharacterized protein LOC116343092 [Contarinia nasturtii]|uniref:uncharacterized protein LOC116343092 n=1 Tax=Contarinia nasturtii TaxID=265458 RepID=UPI0012D46E31|nr:uncharacterized protein LOC116343092 [Contarinia nasturtii]